MQLSYQMIFNVNKKIKFIYIALSSLIFLLFLKYDSIRSFYENDQETVINNNFGMKQLDNAGYNIDVNELLRNVKILCWINTVEELHHKRAIHVKNTWGKRCDKLIFMSSQADDTLPSVNLGFPSDKKFRWRKTKNAFKYVHDNYLNDYGWFMRADDDSYFIIENLRYLLMNYDHDGDPVYFGQRYKFDSSSVNTYMSGGAGYVLSRSAVKIFVENMSNASLCSDILTLGDDVEFGKCLNNLRFKIGDTRDVDKKEKFLHFQPKEYVFPEKLPLVHLERIYDPSTLSVNCCSNLAVSFHHMEPQEMYQIDYLIYNLHPYGVKYSDPLPLSLHKS